jgi:hypothetical protein
MKLEHNWVLGFFLKTKKEKLAFVDLTYLSKTPKLAKEPHT